ncbi:MAG: response regulator transcription factor [Anaerolineae bacterium]
MLNRTVLIVDDDPDIRRQLRGYLEQAGYTVREAADGAEALHDLATNRPDCLILDLMLPEEDGWSITRHIRADSKLRSLPLIMLTARVDDVDKIVGLELGADHYVTKPFNPREMVARVNALLRRAHKPDPAVLEVGPLRLDTDAHTATISGDPLDLTPTEFALLRVFMRRPGYVYTRGELIEQALGSHYEGLERTLDTHIRNLRHKIEPDSAEPAFLLTVYGVGYKLVDPA